MRFHVVTAILEDVSGVAVLRGRNGIWTTFNATINGRREYSVSVRGRPTIESGMKVEAALGDATNWQTLEGWRNLRTGETSGLAPPKAALFALWFFVCLTAIPLALAGVTADRGIDAHHIPLIFAVIMGAACLWLFFSWRKSVAIHELLNRASNE